MDFQGLHNRIECHHTGTHTISERRGVNFNPSRANVALWRFKG